MLWAGCAKEEPVKKVVKELPAFGRITYMEGMVMIKKPQSKRFKKAKLLQKIATGANIRTGAASKAVISLYGLGDASIGENSKVKVSKLFKSKTQKREAIGFENYYGSLFSSVKKLTKSSPLFTVSTPTATAAIRGTSFEVFVDPKTFSSRIIVLKGKVAVRKYKTPKKGPKGSAKKGGGGRCHSPFHRRCYSTGTYPRPG